MDNSQKTAPRFCKERCKIPQVPKARSCAPGCLARHCRVWVLGLVLFHIAGKDSHDTCDTVSLLMEELPQTTYSWIPFFNLPPKKDQKILCIESTATTWNRCSKLSPSPNGWLLNASPTGGGSSVKFRGALDSSIHQPNRWEVGKLVGQLGQLGHEVSPQGPRIFSDIQISWRSFSFLW